MCVCTISPAPDTSSIRVKPENKAVDVKDLKVQAALCCQGGAQCSLCLVIDTQLHIQPSKDEKEDEENSGADEQEDSERTWGQSGVKWIYTYWLLLGFKWKGGGRGVKG